MHVIESKRTHLLSTFIMSVTLALLVLGVHGAFASRVPEIGHPITGDLGVARSTDDLMKLERLNPPSHEPAVVEDEMMRQEPDRSVLPMNPLSPRVASMPNLPGSMLTGYAPGKGLGFHAFSPQTVGVNVRTATLSSFNPTNAFPPDCDGAIGPTQYVVGVNGRIVSFNKTTGLQDGVLNLSTDNFFNSVRAGSGTSDPMVRYDRLSGRWFISIINVSTPNRWLLGVSDAASNGTITNSTVWTFFFFVPATLSPSIGNCLTDYPSLGVDANALYMGGDEFCPSAFQQTDGFVIRKSSVLGAGPIVVTVFRVLGNVANGGPFAPRGVDNLDPGSNEGYFVGADINFEGLLDLYRVSDPGGTPGLSANIPLTVPNTAEPFHVQHLGNTGGSAGRVDALDSRLFYAMMRGQQLWTSHTIAVDNTGVVGNNTRDGSRWYQFNVPVNTGTPTIVQSGIVFTPSATNTIGVNRYYWMPSIAVSGQGHAAMGFSAADSVERINCATVGRLASDPLGTMETPVLLTASATAYNPAGDTGASRGRRRWGDYSITTVDPINDQSMWTVQMYCDTTNSYGVRIAQLVAPPPATPAALPDVAAGYPTVNVTLTGTSSSGSGFFDPGANLGGGVPAFSHLVATVTNGAAVGTPPTVVSATYVDPTTVNLVLNTSAATPNLPSQFYTINITNPDGQVASAAIVHVVSSTQYDINASATAGGTISPSGDILVNSGLSQTFTISPNSCNAIADVQVDGGSVGAVSSYTFSNVSANHTIVASFTPLGPYTINAVATSGGLISPSGSVSVACGGTQAFGFMPAACAHVSDVVVDGVSRGALPSYTFTNVQTNHMITVSFALNAQVAAVTGLGAAQVTSGNDASGTTKITLTFTAPGGATVEVYRKGFGDYPTYAGGSAPALPGSYPPAGWTLTGVTTSGDTDQPPTRDFWYYVAYAKDGCTVSNVSNETNGTLGYHLGDVSDGVTPGQGDNSVNTADASLLGAHYGDSGPAISGFEYLDVGPTTDFSTSGRPTPDGAIGFEDLVLYAINYTPAVSAVAPKGVPVASAHAGSSELTMKAPLIVTAGEDVAVPVTLAGHGDAQAISVALAWDPAVVTPAGVTAGDVMSQQGGVALSPGGGRIDAAVLGQGNRIGGQGLLATMKFHSIASGDPKFGFGKVSGRDGANKAVTIVAHDPLTVGGAVTATELQPVIPNPSRGASVIQYALARGGPVDVSVYSVDGRRVATLAHGVQDVGRYHLTWNGADERGGVVTSGLYFVRLNAPGVKLTRLMTLVR